VRIPLTLRLPRTVRPSLAYSDLICTTFIQLRLTPASELRGTFAALAGGGPV